MSALLTGTSLTRRVAGRTLFADLSVRVGAGSLLAVTGPSGSGKTSLLTVMAGLESPDAGTVELAGRPLGPQFPGGTRSRVGVLLQGYGLVSLLTACENVEVALRGTGTAPDRAQATASELLDRLDLAEHRDRLVEELSGGQQQRVALARALAGRLDVLIADEPTAEQDGEHRSLVLGEIRAAAQRGAAVLLATHDPEISGACDDDLRL